MIFLHGKMSVFENPFNRHGNHRLSLYSFDSELRRERFLKYESFYHKK